MILQTIKIEMIKCPRCEDGYFIPRPTLTFKDDVSIMPDCICAKRCGLIYYENSLQKFNKIVFGCDVGKYNVKWKNDGTTIISIFQLKNGDNQKLFEIDNWVQFDITEKKCNLYTTLS